MSSRISKLGIVFQRLQRWRQRVSRGVLG